MPKDSSTAIVWLHHDLRLRDNPALSYSMDNHEHVIRVFLWTPSEEGKWVPGAASRYWLHQSLSALTESLKDKGSRLIIRCGNSSTEILRKLISESGAAGVYWNRRYEPAATERDNFVQAALEKDGIACETFNGGLLLEPWESRKADDTPYRVFTPFAKACRNKIGRIDLLPEPTTLPAVWTGLSSEPIEALDLEPQIDWASGIRGFWTPGEAGAQAALRHFIKQGLGEYEEQRNFPDNNDGVSSLSPYLHFGEISAKQVWNEISKAAKDLSAAKRKSADVYLNEILWREFSHHLLFHFPDTPEKPLHEKFEKYPWSNEKVKIKAWQQGETGYPIVDAGMRQLWEIGWMHNRVRMIVGSFLIKDLGVDWRIGEAWFWDTLVDADLTQNTMNWQWVAGCGADASPFFRIFNPVTQSKKFDPDGNYIRRYVPELKNLPSKWIHTPFDAPAATLNDAGVELGKNYPKPIVNHARAREQALENYKRL